MYHNTNASRGPAPHDLLAKSSAATSTMGSPHFYDGSLVAHKKFRRRPLWKEEYHLGADFNISSEPRPTLAAFSAVACKTNRLVWLTPSVFVLDVKLEHSPDEFKCLYYVHMSRHSTDRQRSSNLYLHALVGAETEALGCLSFILSLDDTGFDYLAVSCLGTQTNLLLPAASLDSEMSSQCIVQHRGHSSGASSILSIDILQLFMTSKLLGDHLPCVPASRWIVLTDICLTNDQARFFASSSAKLSFNNVCFADGGLTFLQSFIESGRRLKGLRLQKNPFASNEFFATFLREAGHPDSHLEYLELLSIALMGDVLTGLSKTLRSTRRLRFLSLWWTSKEDEKLFLPAVFDSSAHGSLLSGWNDFVDSLGANVSLQEFAMETTWTWQQNTMPKPSRVFLTMEVSRILKANPRISRIPYHDKLYEQSVWDEHVLPILNGEYHIPLIQSLQKSSCHSHRARLVGHVLSKMVATNPTLFFQTLKLHSDIVVQYQL